MSEFSHKQLEIVSKVNAHCSLLNLLTPTALDVFPTMTIHNTNVMMTTDMLAHMTTLPILIHLLRNINDPHPLTHLMFSALGAIS